MNLKYMWWFCDCFYLILKFYIGVLLELTNKLIFSVPGRSLLSISDTPKASFIEIVVDYIVEQFDNTMDLYAAAPETVFIHNDTLFLTWS